MSPPPMMFSWMRLFPGTVRSFGYLMSSLDRDGVCGYRVLGGELPSVWILLGDILVGKALDIVQ